MSNLAWRVAALVVSIVVAQNVVPVGQTAAFAQPAIGQWGFDLAGADLKSNPGDDFFHYGTGVWYDQVVIPPDRGSIGAFTALRINAEGRIRDILEHGENGVDPAVRAEAVKINRFYKSFMNEAWVEALDARPIAPFLHDIRAAGTREDLAQLMGKGSRSFFSSVFALRISPHDKAPDRYAISISQAGLGLNRDYYVTLRLADKKSAYLAYMGQILAMIGWEAPEQSAAAVLAFETAIAEASWTAAERRDPDKTHNPTSVPALVEAMPFPWDRFLASADLGGVDNVILREDSAIRKIAGVYAGTSVETLKAWQAFHLADATAPYLSKRFVAAHFDFHSKTMGGVAQQPERWRRAINTVDGAMGQAIGRVYVARYFPPEAKTQIDDLVVQMRAALKARIERLDWLSLETRSKALDKLERLNVKIAYPTKWRDYSLLEVRDDDLVGNVQSGRTLAWRRQVDRLNSPVERDEWFSSPQTVNAFYSARLNEMVFPAGILQPPFFDPAADPAVNFGGIGAVIGHEIIHGFDDGGRKYDGAGMLSNWWTDSDASQFKARSALLGKQYDSYEPFPGVHVKGDLTMGENIADLGGALVALDAYHRSLGGKPAPVIDGLTGGQRFFLAYAQIWRQKSTDDSIRRLIVSNPHAPPRYRVNGVVRNMDAWYEAFGVKPGDKLFLAPENRVRIW